jgi:glutamine amidotransferase PdxT
MEIGVLASQRDFAEHLATLKRIGIPTRQARLPEHLEGLEGLIILGGESITMGKPDRDGAGGGARLDRPAGKAAGHRVLS